LAGSETGTGRAIRVKAPTVTVRDAFVLERFGLEAQQRYRQAASAGLRRLLLGTDPSDWVDFGLFVEAIELADRLFDRGKLELAWEMGRFAASHDIGVWKRLIMGRVRPSMFIGLAASVWSHHYDRGRLLSRARGPTGLHVTLADFPAPHRAHCLSIGGWMLGSLELGPRRNGVVQELCCRAKGDTSCEFRVAWDE
jgi:hypothetical protein